MNRISTLAIEINENTYSIAVACLPPTFATIPFAQVERHYLVINEVEAYAGPKGIQLRVIGNCWMDRVMFNATYMVMDSADITSSFTNVERIN